MIAGVAEEDRRGRRGWVPRRSSLVFAGCAVAPASIAGAILWISALAFLRAAPAIAQESEKPLRIGVLALGPRWKSAWHCGPRDAQRAAEPRVEAPLEYLLGLRDELETLGYVEDRPETEGKRGRRFVLEVRQGNLEAVRRFARHFVQERVDLIVAIATATVQAAKEAVESAERAKRANPVPILFPNISDPVRDGFARSLAQPGGFLSGLSQQMVQGSWKRVEAFKEMLPHLHRLLTIYQADYGPAQRSVLEMRKAADDLRITLVEKHASSRADVQAVLAEVRRETLDGIIIPADAIVVSNIDLVLEKSLEERVPAFGILDYMADWGALAAYGPSPYRAGRRLARYVDKVANGTKPGDLPVEPLDPTFVVNLKAAACFGISIPLSVLHQADRVIR